VPKPEKVWIIAIFCSTNAIFAVQMLFFWCGEKKIWVCSTNFCRLMAQVLLPYGPVLINRAQYKSLLHFLGGGGGVEVSLRTACCCQRQVSGNSFKRIRDEGEYKLLSIIILHRCYAKIYISEELKKSC